MAVVRVSGPAADAALRALTGRAPGPPRAARRARLRGGDGDTIDRGLVLWFPEPASFTGEDVAEFHVHGGTAVVAALVEALGALPGLRPAEPGEFSRRGFENGKLDLTQAEGLADLVNAETAAQRRQALRQLDGALGALYEDWRARLLRGLAHIESEIDFVDEDLPPSVAAAAIGEIAVLRTEIVGHLDDNRRGERLREGLYVAIVGAPNVGKSSLLNLLARRDAAIVAATAGTTRDVIEVRLELGGYPVTVADTAGLRDSTDAVESEGVRRAMARAAVADLKLALFDACHWPALDEATAGLVDGDTVVVINKSDLRAPPTPHAAGGRPALAISAHSGLGVPELLATLVDAVSERLSGGPSLTRLRHRRALEDCAASLERALAAAEARGDVDLMAEDVRLAARALGRITGRVDVEDILDIVFRDFCIGK